MLFAIHKRYSDTCGGEDSYCLGLCEMPTREDAEKEFDSGFLVGHIVEEVRVVSPEEIHKRFKKHRER